ncbi:MAG: 3-dehydroquinate synthase [Clostridiales bacterium]|nr:3-dehydroquinate synthase [Clostridiales bacterium]
MNKIRVNASSSYDIFIGKDILSQSGQIIKEIFPPCKVALISDSNVMPLYGPVVKNALREVGFSVFPYVFPAGEASKSLDTVAKLLDFFSENGLTRSDIAIALGGGVTGDLTGFAASIFLRGIRYIQIPTSLLAAVDSSVGGKTGVDLPVGKNLAGSFWQPSLVLCDTGVFKTLSPHFLSDGLSEVVKYGMIADRDLFDRLKNQPVTDFFNDIVTTCVSIKRDIVEKDEFDQNERHLLNFGHTIGHAVEKLSNYNISHGHGVAIGMACMAIASDALGLTLEPCADKTIELLKTLNLPVKCPFSAEQVTRAALNDKKVKSDTITLIILKKIGEAALHKIDVSRLETFLSAGID